MVFYSPLVVTYQSRKWRRPRSSRLRALRWWHRTCPGAWRSAARRSSSNPTASTSSSCVLTSLQGSTTSRRSCHLSHPSHLLPCAIPALETAQPFGPTRVYPLPLAPTRFYPLLPASTRFYPRLPASTRSYPLLPAPTRSYPLLPASTRAYSLLLPFAPDYSHQATNGYQVALELDPLSSIGWEGLARCEARALHRRSDGKARLLDALCGFRRAVVHDRSSDALIQLVQVLASYGAWGHMARRRGRETAGGKTGASAHREST